MLGIDIIKTSRMHSLMERFGEKALLRFLCDEEIKQIKNSKSAAGYWAAKEAFSKAIGTGIGAICSFKDIKIYKDERGAPKIALSHKLIQEFNIENVALSITHDGEYAVAVVTVKSSSTTDKVKKF
jgi:holo-[acyl-carrier protein] synthase